MRGLSTIFFESLKKGILQPIHSRINKDDTLMLSIRKGYVNIYYRGGSLLKITEKPNAFEMYFDRKYDLTEHHKIFKLLNLPKNVKAHHEVDRWISRFPVLKELMDFWLSENHKLEREFQQLVERENNRSSISNETEYFITDIELADSNLGARFDMTAVKWLASDRKSTLKCKPAFIEMKYGDNQLKGDAGLIKHISDINLFLKDKQNYQLVLDNMSKQFNQLDELGMIRYNHSKKNQAMKLAPDEKPEYIFSFSKP